MPRRLVAILAGLLVLGIGGLFVRLKPYLIARFRGTNADLRGAMLWLAPLADADLIGANLAGALMRGANLVDANLERANLAGADQ
jgi:hypothetical protein